MTENETIEILKELNENYFQLDKQGEFDDVNSAFEGAISALEEIKQYQALGTVEELREAREKQRAKKIIIVKAKNEIEDVSIGDFVHYKCPSCGERIGSAFHYPPNEYMMEHKFCNKCSQKLDWYKR